MTFLATTVGLATSALWALSSTLFQDLVRVRGAMGCNLYKTGLALVLFWLSTLVVWAASGLQAPTREGVSALMLSGAVGMTIGDFAYFAAIHRVGVRTATLLHGTAPIFLLARDLLVGAPLGILQAVGVPLVVLGVAGVTASGGPAGSGPGDRPRAVDQGGVALGLLAALGQAAGIALSSGPLRECHFVLGTSWRLTGAIAAFALGILFSRRVRWAGSIFSDRLLLGRGTVAVVLGTWLGLGLMTLTIKMNEQSVSGALLSTTPLFVVGMAALRGEKLRWPVVLAVLVGCTGIALLQIGG